MKVVNRAANGVDRQGGPPPGGEVSALDGSEVSSVTSVKGYIQLAFEAERPIGGLSLFNPLRILKGKRVWERGALGFCDELCSLVGMHVVAARSVPGQELSFTF